MNNEERWAQIEGFPDYAVSTHGKVANTKHNRLLSLRPNSYGGLRVVLYDENGQRHDRYVHHLVAAAFTTGYIPGTQVRQFDRDKTNNNVFNLRFRGGVRMGNLVRKPPPPNYRRIRIVGTEMVFDNISECADFVRGDTTSIYRVLRGEREMYKGYSFEYEYG